MTIGGAAKWLNDPPTEMFTNKRAKVVISLFGFFLVTIRIEHVDQVYFDLFEQVKKLLVGDSHVRAR